MGSDVLDEPYHISAIRNQLTRNLGVLLPSVMDEIQTAFRQLVHLKDDGLSTSPQSVARTHLMRRVGERRCSSSDDADRRTCKQPHLRWTSQMYVVDIARRT